jgi:hypothetical protein
LLPESPVPGDHRRIVRARGGATGSGSRIQFELIRPDDLVNLLLEAINLRVDSTEEKRPRLVVDDESQPAWLAVAFPPQSLAETAWDTTGPTPDPPGGSGVAAAHPSRLVFSVQPGSAIALASASLLDWSALTPSLTPTAAVIEGQEGVAAPPIQAPAETETAIELPYRLLISPDPRARWRSRSEPFTTRGRTELWHTRLVLTGAVGGGELSHLQQAPLRAVWSPDYQPSGAGGVPNLGLSAMTADDRRQLVILTSAFRGWANSGSQFSSLPFRLGSQLARPLSRAYVPSPFHAELLMLSALGGWLRSRGNWVPPHSAPDTAHALGVREVLSGALTAIPTDEPLHRRAFEREPITAILGKDAETPPPEQLDLSEWVHIAAQGRDHYVRIVYEGRLLPFGHRAALIKITERKFEEVDGVVGAYLMQRKFIVVRIPVVDFAHGDRGMPLKRVRLTTLITPDLAGYSQDGQTGRGRFERLAPVTLTGRAASTSEDPKMLWAEVPTGGGGRTPFPFQCVATDIGGNSIDFSMAMLFVSDRITDLASVAHEYNTPTTLSDPAARDAKVPGQRLLYAEPAGGSENTRLVTEVLNFKVGDDSKAPFLNLADVRIPQVESLLGSDAATTISLFDTYVKNGIGAAGGVFAAVPDPLDVQFQAQKAGGIATPNMGVTSLSRDHGPLSGNVNDAVSGAFDPKSFFGTLDPQLFGSFKLSDILDSKSLAEGAPKLTTSSSADGAGGTIVETRLDWRPKIRAPDPPAGFVHFKPDTDSQLDVNGVIRKSAGAASGASAFTFNGTLTNVTVEIVDAVAIKFKSFSFVSANGAKPVVNVQLREPPMEFLGDLAFVDELRQQIPPGLFGDGPSIELIDNPLGVRAGFAVTLPPIGVGVFALKDVALGAAVTLPFVEGNPLFDFNVSRRDHPFLVAVAIFGGGGFFHLQSDASGMRELEASLEFGAAASIDIGVASGSVHMMAGIYFSLQKDPAGTHMKATLSGYLRMGGSLSVLGLITVSVEFNLSFTYDIDKDKAYGCATLTVEVEVACFSKSVDLTVQRGFGGSGDPKFADLITTPETWSEYALAFAA